MKKHILLLLVSSLYIMASAQPGGNPDTLAQQDDEMFDPVEDLPRFPGCEDLPGSIIEKQACAQAALMAYIAKHMKYPLAARKAHAEGVVVIKFVVKQDGSIENPEVERSVHPLLDEVALDIVRKMPKWRPAYRRSKPQEMIYHLPFRFKLE